MAKNLDITIICAHPSSVLEQQSLLNEKGRISHEHSLTIDLNEFIGKTARAIEPPQLMRILIAEPEPDIRTMYQRYLTSLPVEIVAIESGAKCLQHVQVSNKGMGLT